MGLYKWTRGDAVWSPETTGGTGIRTRRQAACARRLANPAGKEEATMSKEQYTPVEMEVITFDVEDVITTSVEEIN